MTINWRRGLLRLWIVAALVWCSVVAINANIPPASDLVHIKFSNTETWDYPVAWGVDRIEADLKTRIDAKEKAEHAWVAEVPDARKAECKAIPKNTLFSDMPKDCVRIFFADMKLAVPDGWQAEVQNTSAKRWGAIKSIALWAIVPPLAALVLGLLLGWVSAGFRQSSS